MTNGVNPGAPTAERVVDAGVTLSQKRAESETFRGRIVTEFKSNPAYSTLTNVALKVLKAVVFPLIAIKALFDAHASKKVNNKMIQALRRLPEGLDRYDVIKQGIEQKRPYDLPETVVETGIKNVYRTTALNQRQLQEDATVAYNLVRAFGKDRIAYAEKLSSFEEKQAFLSAEISRIKANVGKKNPFFANTVETNLVAVFADTLKDAAVVAVQNGQVRSREELNKIAKNIHNFVQENPTKASNVNDVKEDLLKRIRNDAKTLKAYKNFVDHAQKRIASHLDVDAAKAEAKKLIDKANGKFTKAFEEEVHLLQKLEQLRNTIPTKVSQLETEIKNLEDEKNRIAKYLDQIKLTQPSQEDPSLKVPNERVIHQMNNPDYTVTINLANQYRDLAAQVEAKKQELETYKKESAEREKSCDEALKETRIITQAYQTSESGAINFPNAVLRNVLKRRQENAQAINDTVNRYTDLVIDEEQDRTQSLDEIDLAEIDMTLPFNEQLKGLKTALTASGVGHGQAITNAMKLVDDKVYNQLAFHIHQIADATNQKIGREQYNTSHPKFGAQVLENILGRAQYGDTTKGAQDKVLVIKAIDALLESTSSEQAAS